MVDVELNRWYALYRCHERESHLAHESGDPGVGFRFVLRVSSTHADSSENKVKNLFLF